MIKYVTKNRYLLLEYSPLEGTKWIYDKFEMGESITIKNTYTFIKDDVYHKDNVKDAEEVENGEVITFILGELNGNYYKLKRSVLSIDKDIYIEKGIHLNQKMFTAVSKISIFRKINAIFKNDIYIGNRDDSNLPLRAFKRLLVQFPNSYELNKYARARISIALRDYFDCGKDAEVAYETYLNKKKITQKGENILIKIAEQEKNKYRMILHKLKDMLKKQINYNEKQWQMEILQIIKLLYPKYIDVFEEVRIRDIYKNKTRRLDYMLVDTNGNIDIIEIKRPYSNSIISENKYRDNYIPMKELTGSVMQIEKYIYYLNKWGKNGEDILTSKYENRFPKGFRIRIINPCGIVIMGRENDLTQEQIEDFDVIKRKYKSIIDILTYDELIRRIEILISKFA